MTTNTNKTTAVGGTSSNRSGPPAELYEQFVFTHCRPDESCNGEAGFQMRMRSCADPQMQEFTSKLSYEPLDTQMHLPEASPQRLAWLTCPVDGKKDHYVLAHSRYLGRDTEGRWGNYYTRTIFYPRRKSLKQILQCCDSSLWDDLDFGNKGIETSAKFSGIPERGASVDDQQLYRFLSDEQFPGRIGKIAPEQRRRLLAWTTTACLKALNSEPAQHVYIHAEPSLVALLLFGAATVLPEGFMRQLTFSTYEKPGHQLRSFKSATVIGTITDHPEEGLHDDFLERQGFVLDTFRLTCSPEVKSPLFDRLDDYIDLAANAKWDKLKELHSLFSLADTITPKTPGQAWQVHSDRELLTANAESLPDHEVVAALQRLQSLELGQKLLNDDGAEGNTANADIDRRRCREYFWGLMRTQCTLHPELRVEFSETLTHASALQQHLDHIAKLIVTRNDSWRKSWRLYRELRNKECDADFKELLIRVRILLDANKLRSLEFTERIALLQEYQKRSNLKGQLDRQLTWLLVLEDAENVWDFSETTPPFPGTWTGQALARSVQRKTATEIAQFLLRASGKDETSGDLWDGFKTAYHKELPSEDRKQTLQLMFSLNRSDVIDLFFLLKERLGFDESDLLPSQLTRLLEDDWNQLEGNPKRQYSWMHLQHWSEINKVEMIFPYLGRNAVSARIWEAVFEAMGLGLLCKEKTRGSAFIKIRYWLKEHPGKFPDETRKRIELMVKNYRSISPETIGLVLRFLQALSILLVGFFLGLVVSSWGERILNYFHTTSDVSPENTNP